MAISFNDNHLHASVVATAIHTQSVDKAYAQMGFLEKIIDYFRGDVKYSMIKALINEVANAEPRASQDETVHTKNLVQFEKLSSLAKDEHRNKFSIELSVDEEKKTWGYALKIEQMVIRQAEDIPLMDNMDFLAYEAAYQDQEMVNYFADILYKSGDKESIGKVAHLRESLAQVNNEYVNLHSGFDVSDSNRAEKFKLIANHLPAGIQELRATIDIDKNSYHLRLGDRIFYAAAPSAEYQAALPSLWAAKIQLDIKNDLYDFRTHLAKENMLSVVQEMADLPEEQEAIRNALMDPLYSKDNLLTITVKEDGQRMIAQFKGNKELVFAGPSRPSTNKELRGNVLIDRLQTTSYANLYELITSVHLTADDSLFFSLVRASIENNLLHARPMLNEEEMASLTQQIALIEVGNTSVATLLDIAVEVSLLNPDYISGRV